MKLNAFEQAMRAGEMGAARQRAIEQQIQVGRFFDAEDFVEVVQAHIMADTESLGEAGVRFLEELAAEPESDNRVCIPTITDPRGADFNTFERIRHDPAYVELERRADQAFRALGILMTDTCINYQTILPPVRGEHLAMGDTGVVIYSNSVFGARTNYEGGPSALAAALTGRTPRYGFHLDEMRRGTRLFRVEQQPTDWSQWGALGGFIGREMGSYYDVPVLDGITSPPGSDDLKHFGAAMASFGSTALFHMIGVTPEAPDLATVFANPVPPARAIKAKDITDFFASYAMPDDALDVVVFAAPQLSLFELDRLAGLLQGQQIHADVSLLIATSPENKRAAERMGLDARISKSGAILMEGVCFYQMHARELGEANGWKRLMTNSAKLVNIIGGYGYEPMLADMERCVASAIAGRIV
ncbi:MAG: aconitase X catalytic domain-containing protein [Rhodospirillales bacterium]|nr:aconitase X catalytic domain-containing protein [Rhodospirillales bacterium]